MAKMSETKSKVISFRLSGETAARAEQAARAAGKRNAGAWCQTVVTDALSALAAAAAQNTNNLPPTEDPAKDEWRKAVANLRRLNLECFGLLLKNKDNYAEFLEVAIESEENWELIGNRGKERLPDEFPGAAAPRDETAPPSAGVAPAAVPETETRAGAEKGFAEFDSFSAEIENELAELLDNENEPTDLLDAGELSTNVNRGRKVKIDGVAQAHRRQNLLPLFTGGNLLETEAAF